MTITLVTKDIPTEIIQTDATGKEIYLQAKVSGFMVPDNQQKSDRRKPSQLFFIIRSRLAMNPLNGCRLSRSAVLCR